MDSLRAAARTTSLNAVRVAGASNSSFWPGGGRGGGGGGGGSAAMPNTSQQQLHQSLLTPRERAMAEAAMHPKEIGYADVKVFGMPRRFFVIYLPLLVHNMCTDLAGPVGALSLFYSNAKQWTNTNDAVVFTSAVALQSLLPAFAGPLLSRVAALNGPKLVTLSCMYISLVAILMVFLIKRQVVFTVCSGLMALQGASMQPVRLLYINRSVPFQMRTRYLSIIALVGVSGTLISCVLMVLYYKMLEGPENTQTLFTAMDGRISFDLDRSTISYLFAAFLTVVNIVLTHTLLEEVEPVSHEDLPSLPVVRPAISIPSPAVSEPVGSGGTAGGTVGGTMGGTMGSTSASAQAQAQQHLQQVVIFFMAVVILSSITHGLNTITVIPFLVDKSGFSPAQVAVYGVCSTVLAVVPPAILTIFPHVKDRSILIIALVNQIFVAVIFSLGNDTSWWPVGIGGLLASHSFSFVFISSMHIYSLLVSSQENESILLKVPTFCQSLGVGLGYLFGGIILFYWYRTPWILFSAIPSMAVLGMVLHPWFYARLDPPYCVPWSTTNTNTPRLTPMEVQMEPPTET